MATECGKRVGKWKNPKCLVYLWAEKITMNTFGLILLGKPRYNASTKLRADELHFIAVVIDINPCEVLKEVYKISAIKD
mgnify:CR=1 FL=1